MTRTPMSTELEVEILQSKVASLEAQVQWLNRNWVEWTKSTKETGQRIMIALEEITSNKE